MKGLRTIFFTLILKDGARRTWSHLWLATWLLLVALVYLSHPFLLGRTLVYFSKIYMFLSCHHDSSFNFNDHIKYDIFAESYDQRGLLWKSDTMGLLRSIKRVPPRSWVLRRTRFDLELIKCQFVTFYQLWLLNADSSSYIIEK